MTLLLVILFAVSVPALPQVEVVVPSAPTTLTMPVVWSPSTPDGCTYAILWGDSTATMTNKTDVGTNTTAKVRVFDTLANRRYFTVRATLDGIESKPGNVWAYPPKLVDTVFAQRDGKDIGIVDVWTNPPARRAAQYRLRIQRTKDYTP